MQVRIVCRTYPGSLNLICFSLSVITRVGGFGNVPAQMAIRNRLYHQYRNFAWLEIRTETAVQVEGYRIELANISSFCIPAMV